MCLHFIWNNSATFFFLYSLSIIPSSTTILVLKILTFIVFTLLLLYLATKRLSIASLSPSNTYVIAIMKCACDVKHSPLVKGLSSPAIFLQKCIENLLYVDGQSDDRHGGCCIGRNGWWHITNFPNWWYPCTSSCATYLLLNIFLHA